jgi:cyclopropane-fatty-acyl-phospholipid synthase
MSSSVLEDTALENSYPRTTATDLRRLLSHRSSPGWLPRLENKLLHWLLVAVGNPPLGVRLWNEPALTTPDSVKLPRVEIRDRGTLWKLAIDPLFQFGEAYADGRLEVDGDFTELLMTVFRCWYDQVGRRPVVTRLVEACHLPHRNTLGGSRDNVHHHYDLGNDFYRLWLDREMSYTCAYFARPTCTLEEAQIAKMHHVCRKLRLRNGETVVEAGCGWGALALFMARHYGISVKACNISREQIAYARGRAAQEGLAGRVEFIQDDWRNLRGRYDAFVSIGMLEHVGLDNYWLLGKTIRRCLSPGGRGLIHTIGQTQRRPMNPWIERRIFPGAYPPTLAQIMEVLAPQNFAVLDVENLRPHYAETLRHWRDRFESRRETVRTMFDERFVRMWRLYLCGSLAAFATGGLQLFQVLFADPANDRLPWTRADMYEPSLDDGLADGPPPGPKLPR